MKNNLLKYYIAGFYLCSVFMMSAQPGAQNGDNTLEADTDTTPATPIDDYIWVLAAIGLVFVFMKYRAMQNRKVNS